MRNEGKSHNNQNKYPEGFLWKTEQTTDKQTALTVYIGNLWQFQYHALQELAFYSVALHGYR